MARRSERPETEVGASARSGDGTESGVRFGTWLRLAGYIGLWLMETAAGVFQLGAFLLRRGTLRRRMRSLITSPAACAPRAPGAPPLGGSRDGLAEGKKAGT